VYVVDDGTQLICCILWNQSRYARALLAKPLPLSALVQIRGRISDYSGIRQLTVHSWWTVTDPHVEVYFWLQTNQLMQSVYRIEREEKETEIGTKTKAMTDD
jgi:hypothetical protein